MSIAKNDTNEDDMKPNSMNEMKQTEEIKRNLIQKQKTLR